MVQPIATEIRTQLDLRPYALMRGETPQGDRPLLVLPRARVLLTLLLPTASEPGPYEVEIRESGALSRRQREETPVFEIRSLPLKSL